MSLAMEYGLIGRKLGHSYSKEIHETIENYTYTLKELEPEAVDEFMQKREFRAINVTIPYKEKVIPHLHYISDLARKNGAVNTVVNRDGKLYGYNTDCLGLKAMMDRAGIDLRGKKVLILGTGGTSKTAKAVSAETHAAQVWQVSRSAKDGCITYEEMYAAHTDADVIINTTPCGMYPDCVSSPVDLDRFNRLCGVVDAIYNPLRTPLVAAALERGIRATGGLYMLVSQAVFAAEKFTGNTYPPTLTDEIYGKLVADKENIVLAGMPGCGKTTVGKALAERTGRRFIDTDALIVEAHGMPITEIFAKYGEQVFRDWEAECVLEASKNSGCIIATGGGAVLRKANVAALKRNGRIYFLDRPLSALVPTADRPLASDMAAVEKRYAERYPIYKAVADASVLCTDMPASVAAKILTMHTEENKR